METKALGKGLSALIPDKTNIEPGDNIKFVKTTDIKENMLQPRRKFDDNKLANLIASIKEKGVLQPILVRRKGEKYEVIAGERRLRAVRALAIDEIPVIIKTVDDREALVLALVENIQREELNAIEEAHAYRRLVGEFNFTQDTVAQSVAKDRSTITNTLRLLKLPIEIQKAIVDEAISMGHARALIGIEDENLQKKLFERTVRDGLSVRELENLTKPVLTHAGKGRKISSSQKDPHVAALEDDLQKALGTKVRVLAKTKRGKIIIEYYSLADLERITQKIKGK